MTRFVQDMAEYYGTTQTLAKTRLLDMGYSEVRGVLQSANRELIPAYLSDLEEGQKYDVDHSDALKEYVRNPAFREVLDSGQYIYCEGHFCLNDSRYIQLDHLGRSHLAKRMYAFEKRKTASGLICRKSQKNFILGGHAVPPSKPLDFTDFLP